MIITKSINNINISGLALPKCLCNSTTNRKKIVRETRKRGARENSEKYREKMTKANSEKKWRRCSTRK